jgi:hypothetical protein
MLDAICQTTECWSATGSMMSGWAAIGGVFAVIFAAHKAADTFKSYRRQKQEDRRIDAAERILTLAYSLKRTLASVRSPMSSGGENYDTEQQLQELAWYQAMDANQKRKAQIGQVILRRLQHHKDDWDQIFVVMPMARALFGEHVEAQLQAFWQKVVAVNVSAEMYRDDRGTDPEFTQRMERDFWGHGGERDDVGREVEEIVRELEKALLPVIRADYERTAKRSWWSRTSRRD